MNGDSLRRIVGEIAYRRARQNILRQSLPRLVAVYINRRSGTRSLHGPVIERAYLALCAREIPVSLGLRGLALLDVLVRHKPTSLSAGQIESILRTDPACRRLGRQRLLNRRVIKVYIQRLRRQLARTLATADIAIEPKRLIASEDTELKNQTAYRLAIPCKIVYRDDVLATAQ